MAKGTNWYEFEKSDIAALKRVGKSEERNFEDLRM